ncbi:MAG TPA: DUF2997 domain-containing protein [bacterium]|jgi:hypothetical protein
MAIKEEFEIRISKNGEIKITARGFSGQACDIPLHKLKQLIDENGISTIQHTDEYYKVTDTVDTKIKK